MAMKYEDIIEILERINDSDLSKDNIIDKIRKELQSSAEYLDVYTKWVNGNTADEKSYNINHLFEVEVEVGFVFKVSRFTLLHFAAESGNKELVDVLLAAKADVNAKSNEGVTPLHSAVKGGNIDIVDALLAAKSNVNTKNDYGFTPLHYAAEDNNIDEDSNIDIVDALLANGANPLLKDQHGNTPKDFAGNKDIIQLLEKAEEKQLRKEAIVKGIVVGIVVALAIGFMLGLATPLLPALTMVVSMVVGAMSGAGTYLISRPSNTLEVADEPKQPIQGESPVI